MYPDTRCNFAKPDDGDSEDFAAPRTEGDEEHSFVDSLRKDGADFSPWVNEVCFLS